KKTLNVYDPPVAYISSYQQPKGSRFGGDALYNGENRPYGAMLTYSINRPEEKKENKEEDSDKKKKKKGAEEKEDVQSDEKKVTYDSVTVEVFNGNELIRTLKSKAPEENGIHRTYWYMDEKGVSRMSRRNRRGN